MTWQLDKSNHDKYLDACRVGIEKFRADDTVKMIIENSSLQSGREYYELVHELMPELMEYADRFATSDKVGNPETHYIGKQKWSPTTLRYIKTLMDLIINFGSLDGLRICEIGSGYGGLCKLIHDIFQPDSYTLYDLDEAKEIQYQYLGTFGCVPNQSYPGYDLVIACSSWSELSREHQREYFDFVIKKCAHGYFQLNYDIDYSLGLLREWRPSLIVEDMFYGEFSSEKYKPYNNIIIC